jgi:regulator of telomere elongation helicase 1
MPWDPMDIEEIHKVAQRHQFCPYYASKERAGAADLIFMPYNYLIEEKIRENFEINYSNSIMIFDEAHNITSA